MNPQDHPNELIRIGQIVGAFGIRGQVKVEPFTDFVSRFDKGKELFLKGEWVMIESSTIHKGRPLLKLRGVDTATAAESLQWQFLEIESGERPELEEDEYFSDDLVGLKVLTTSGQELGEVEEVLAYPAHDVLQVGEVLIPVVKQFIKEINFDDEKIVVELIYGMLPGEE